MYQKYVELREKNKTTDYKVSKGAGVTKSTFTDWKTGRSTPKLDKLQKIADYFGVPIKYFIGIGGEKVNVNKKIEYSSSDVEKLQRGSFDVGCKEYDVMTIEELIEYLKNGWVIFYEGDKSNEEIKCLALVKISRVE